MIAVRKISHASYETPDLDKQAELSLPKMWIRPDWRCEPRSSHHKE